MRAWVFAFGLMIGCYASHDRSDLADGVDGGAGDARTPRADTTGWDGAGWDGAGWDGMDTGDTTGDATDLPATCAGVGQVGGACRWPGGTCASGLDCRPELEDTLRVVRGVMQGEPDPEHPGFFRAAAMQLLDRDVPFAAFTNSLCTAPCDTALEARETAATGELDTCGPCAACSTEVGLHGFVDSRDFFTGRRGPFGRNSGFCRANCVFDPLTNGGCPGGTTCDPRSLICIEACTSDTECQASLEEVRWGERVSLLHPERGTCNLTTGRCATGRGTDGVGRTCQSAADCSVDVGVCAAGGTCAEANCGFASDTLVDGACDGGRGVCLGMDPDRATLCVEGCIAPSDCNPGTTCLPLGAEIGPMHFRGACTTLCDVWRDGGEDTLVPCRSDERCDMARGAASDREGVCRPTCAGDTDCPRPDERCELVSGETYGFCRVPDQLCEPDELDAACFLGQRCDLLAVDTDEGRCVEPCTDTSCPAGLRCEPTRRVCRRACGTDGDCPMEQACPHGLCEQSPG